jgi:hypothetical protein
MRMQIAFLVMFTSSQKHPLKKISTSLCRIFDRYDALFTTNGLYITQDSLKHPPKLGATVAKPNLMILTAKINSICNNTLSQA